MQTEAFILVFFLFCVLGILLSLTLPSTDQAKVLAGVGSLSAVALIAAGANLLISNDTFCGTLWSLPQLGTLSIHFDRLSAIFVLITGLVLFPASFFAGNELKSKFADQFGKAFTVMMLCLYASMVLIFLADDALLFLLAWETMSILCWLLIVGGKNKESGFASAGYFLLALGEAGTLAVAMGFLVFASKAHSLDFTTFKAAAAGLSPGIRWSIFWLTFMGFGVKAGLVPINFWLPRAYVAAPRGFVPILAGVTLNLGLYGILRVNTDILSSTLIGPGLVVLVIGTGSALLGILYATTENDLKMVLAYSSIENAGIVMAGLGAGMIFVAAQHPALAAIAFVASLYHLINHSVYKTLLFIGVGAIEARVGTRDMDQLGGLIKWMPLTAICFLIGTLSIAALPPLNGFVSEWLTLQTMLRSAELTSTLTKLIFVLCGAGLALTAALAVTCFVKVFAMSFLGMHRSGGKRLLVEPPSGVLVPMAILSVLCIWLGVLPTYVIPVLDSAMGPMVGASASDQLVPPFFSSSAAHGELPASFVEDFHHLGAQVGQSVLPGRGLVVLHQGGVANPVVFAMSTSYMIVVLILLLLVVYGIVRLWLTRKRKLERRIRWDGGVRRLLPEMTYTATGFSNPVRVIFDAVFRPTTVEDTRETVAEHFRTAIRREKERVPLFENFFSHPVKLIALWIARRLGAMHHGRINAYITYAFLALLAVWIIFSLFLIS